MSREAGSAGTGAPGPARLRVVEVTPETDARWDRFVEERREGVPYQRSAWLRALAAEYDERQVGLACEDEAGRLHGVMPLAYTRGVPLLRKSELFGRRLASLPRTPVAGPVADSAEATAALVRAARERAASESPRVRLQVKRLQQDLDGIDGWEGRPWRQTFIRELPASPEELRFGNSRNHSRVRWAVNSARKQGVEVRPAEEEADLRRWYALYLETMRSLPVPPRPYRFFAALWRFMAPAGQLELLLAERRDGPRRIALAGSIFLMSGSYVGYAFTGAIEGELHLRPQDAIQFHALRSACERGFRDYDFGEVPEYHTGLAAFKRKWGATPRRMYRYYDPTPSDGGEDRPAAGLVRAWWRRLPLAATAAVGDQVYRYL